MWFTRYLLKSIYAKCSTNRGCHHALLRCRKGPCTKTTIKKTLDSGTRWGPRTPGLLYDWPWMVQKIQHWTFTTADESVQKWDKLTPNADSYGPFDPHIFSKYQLFSLAYLGLHKQIINTKGNISIFNQADPSSYMNWSSQILTGVI